MRAGDRADATVMVTQNYRFRRQSRALQSLVADDTLGRPLGIQISHRRDLRGLWVSRRDWRGRLGHPFSADMAIHHVDMLRQITGREVAEVDARAWKVPDAPFVHEPSVAAVLTLDDGTPVAYDGSWVATTGETSWNGDWVLVGERARADVDRRRQRRAPGDRDPRALRVPRRHALRSRRAYRPSIGSGSSDANLRRAVAEGRPPECSAADNVRSLAVVLALARSAEEAGPVRP